MSDQKIPLPPPEKIRDFQEKIFEFYEKNRRDFPWRRTQDPWLVLVSEVMLQQTQAARVVPFFEKWAKKYPTPADLARVGNPELLENWRGLGFWRRAQNLRACAQNICSEFGGKIPRSERALLKLPGIGNYTAAAICAFAWNLPAGVLDTNIRRVLTAEFDLPDDLSDKVLRHLAQNICPPDRARDFWNAVMDFGAIKATARKTGIAPRSRQSKFEGSRRQARSKILRTILSGNGRESALKNLAGGHDFREILTELAAENFIKKTRHGWEIAK